jgi:hypothetical protein
MNFCCEYIKNSEILMHPFRSDFSWYPMSQAHLKPTLGESPTSGVVEVTIHKWSQGLLGWHGL